MRYALASLLLLAFIATPAFAHGGQYKGPGDGGAASSAGGGNAAPPTNPGGAAAAGPGAPSSGAASSGPTSGGATRGQGNRQATTGGGTEIFAGYEIWEYWWENNKDAYLDLKNRLVKVNSASGSLGVLSGRGSRAEVSTSARPDDALIQSEVIPALVSLLKDGESRDILDSAVLALGRISKEQSAQTVIDASLPLLRHNELSVQSSATLSLGVLGSPLALPVLNELMANTSKGRQLAGGSDVNYLMRAFAALSLGLIDQPESVEPLIDIIKNSKDSDRDIRVGAIVGLGLMHDNPSVEKGAAFLTELLGDRKIDPVILSYVPTSLGKLHRAEATPALLKVFLDRDTDNYVLQSAAIALGMLGSIDQKDVVKALSDYVQEGKDMQTRHFCFISLAQIGARDTDHDAHLEAHQALVKLLGDEITKPKAKTNRSWAAIASAIYAQKQDVAQPPLMERIGQAYKKESDPSFKSAFALALGLLKANAFQEDIYADYRESGDPDFRGYAAVALGFLKYTDAADEMRARVEDKTTTPTLRLQVATGLGLMGDPQATTVLIKALESAQTLGVSSAVAKALGLIGDRTAIDPLRKLALDTKVTPLTRAFACVALGLVCEKTDLPWNARISADNNYRARVPAIDEILDIL